MMRPRPRGPLPPARGTSRPRRKRDLANKIPYPSFKGKGFWFTYSGPIVVLFIFAVSYWANKHIQVSITSIEWPSIKADKPHGRIKRQGAFAAALDDGAVSDAFLKMACPELDHPMGLAETTEATEHLRTALENSRVKHQFHIGEPEIVDAETHWRGWWRNESNHFKFSLASHADHTDQQIRDWSIAARSRCYESKTHTDFGSTCGSPHFALVYGSLPCKGQQLVLSESFDLTLDGFMQQLWDDCKFDQTGAAREHEQGFCKSRLKEKLRGSLAQIFAGLAVLHSHNLTHHGLASHAVYEVRQLPYWSTGTMIQYHMQATESQHLMVPSYAHLIVLRELSSQLHAAPHPRHLYQYKDVCAVLHAHEEMLRKSGLWDECDDLLTQCAEVAALFVDIGSADKTDALLDLPKNALTRAAGLDATQVLKTSKLFKPYLRRGYHQPHKTILFDINLYTGEKEAW